MPDDIMKTMELRFQSGNTVPVERAYLKRSEWELIAAKLLKRGRFVMPPSIVMNDAVPSAIKTLERMGFEYCSIDGGKHYDWYQVDTEPSLDAVGWDDSESGLNCVLAASRREGG